MNAKSGQMPKQLSMWDSIIPDPGPPLKAAMNEALRACSLSREQVCDRMNRMAVLAGVTCNGKCKSVTAALLDKWVAPSATGHMIPLRLLPIFCRAVESNAPFEVYGACFAGARVVSEEAYQVLQWAQSEIEARKARKRAKRQALQVGIE